MFKSKHIYLLSVIVCILLISFDQFTKYLAFTMLKPIGTFTMIKGIFDLTFVENRGAAFGIMQGGRWFFVVVTPIVLVGIVVYFIKLPKTKPYNLIRITLIAVISGAFGNYIDRFRNGYVIDFFHVRFIEFPVFNVADIFVVTGTICMAVILLFFVKENDVATTDKKIVESE